MEMQTTLTPQEILAFLSESGTIDLDGVEAKVKMKKIDSIVSNNHAHKIWQGKDGRWRTFVFDETKPKKRRMVVKSTRESLLEYLYSILAADDAENVDTLESLYPKWLEHKKLEAKSDLYTERIDRDWKRFYMNASLIKIPLTELSPLEIEEWLLKQIKENHLTKTCFYNMRIILSQGLDYAVRQGFIKNNPMADVKINPKLLVHYTKGDDKDQVFTNEEIQDFSEKAWSDFYEAGKKVYRLAPLAALAVFYLGVRVGELTGLQECDIHGNDLLIRRSVRREDHKVVDPKSYAAVRLIPLSEQSRQIIQAALKYKQESGATGPWIFSEYERPLPSRIVEKYYQKYGVQKEIRRGDKIIHKGKSTHNARKTCISSMIDSNMNINTVRKIVGHTDERTTLKHYVFDRSTPDEQRLQFENATKYECNHL